MRHARSKPWEAAVPAPQLWASSSSRKQKEAPLRHPRALQGGARPQSPFDAAMDIAFAAERRDHIWTASSSFTLPIPITWSQGRARGAPKPTSKELSVAYYGLGDGGDLGVLRYRTAMPDALEAHVPGGAAAAAPAARAGIYHIDASPPKVPPAVRGRRRPRPEVAGAGAGGAAASPPLEFGGGRDSPGSVASSLASLDPPSLRGPPMFAGAVGWPLEAGSEASTAGSSRAVSAGPVRVPTLAPDGAPDGSSPGETARSPQHEPFAAAAAAAAATAALGDTLNTSDAAGEASPANFGPSRGASPRSELGDSPRSIASQQLRE